ncbi:aldo/keto reductase [Anaerosinus gibii]|uniref:Aldo/keto reductase n=1 Tax=Selenobaculum gibii TaxID=3054208 RepID=A0A9Y2AJF0_9FIRM|nr:aldo/keto reductase [Selenobaculum gbiensis]WIW70530.1 aldo/keto reductase [Selenobaculum gbiensis]
MKELAKCFKLSNGYEIPQVGFGTWQTPNGETATQAVKAALQCGYRHIDTAAIYGNEKSVGEGIRKSGVCREDLFVTSKVWNTERGYEKTLAAFDKTLADLGLEYLNLYLIHWPANEKQFENWQEINKDTWRAMETLYLEGKIKSIGVSNFLVHHLEPLLAAAKIEPMINQIEFHPGQMQLDTVEFCKRNQILVEAWSPLGTGRMLNNSTLMAIAEKYQKSVAQLCIRWCLQNEVLPLPKSVTPSRIKENTEVFDFVLSAEDMEIINDMKYCGGSGLNPDEVEF